jgi:O-antigen ligase
MTVEPERAERRTTRWWPAARTVDAVGASVLLAFVLWIWWASRVQGAEAGPLIALLLAMGAVAALARWATFFHGTGAPALALGVLLLYAVVTRDGAPSGFGPDETAEAAGALLSVATGLAALVAVRAGNLGVRSVGGLAAAGLAVWTWSTGSTLAVATVLVVLVAAVALGLLPMRGERRWLVVWPALVAVLAVLGTVTYAAFPMPGDADLGLVDPARLELWDTALELIDEEPLYGVGLGTVPDVVDDGAGHGWARHEPLQLTAETGFVGGVLLLGLLWWALAWVARPGGGPGSIVAGIVIAGSVLHACFVPIWHVPAIPLALAALAGVASTRGSDAVWRLEALWNRYRSKASAGDDAGTAGRDGSPGDGRKGEGSDDAEAEAARTRPPGA